jgi:SecD/SecF fusion protein
LFAGILVALIGLILVALYLLAFYRGLGILTAGAIAVFATLYLGILALLSAFNLFALSLAGIAGIVLSIGVAADSSILVLERFKEEIRMGRSVRAASITGVKHAIITSIDADLVTLISALALFIIAVGSVKGFGLTLALGVVCDVLTMILFKAPLVRLLAPRSIAHHPGFWGVREDEELALASGELDRSLAVTREADEEASRNNKKTKKKDKKKAKDMLADETSNDKVDDFFKSDKSDKSDKDDKDDKTVESKNDDGNDKTVSDDDGEED